jgi:hypothetical protein
MTARDSLDERADALFGAARLEAPSTETRQRALHALLEARRGARSPGSAEESAAATAWWPRIRPLRKPIAALAAAALVAAACFIWLRPRPPETLTLSPEDRPSASIPLRRETAPSAEPAPPIDAADIKSATPRRPPPRPPVSARAAPSATPPRALSLPEEVALLDRARAALAAGDAKRALEILDEHGRVPGGAMLAAEAGLLRIQALSRAGQAQKAAQEARRFIDANPGSTLAERARAFAGAGATTSDAGATSDAGPPP